MTTLPPEMHRPDGTNRRLNKEAVLTYTTSSWCLLICLGRWPKLGTYGKVAYAIGRPNLGGAPRGQFHDDLRSRLAKDADL